MRVRSLSLDSHVAEHTHNNKANQKVSLSLFDPNDAENPSSSTRITYLQNATPAQN